MANKSLGNNQIQNDLDIEKEEESFPELEKVVENNSESNVVKSESDKPTNNSPGAIMLRSWLNKTLKVEMSDGRILVGVFLCTDRDANIILGSCSEFLPGEEDTSISGVAEEPRVLGLVMVPGKHIVTICIDQIDLQSKEIVPQIVHNDVVSVNTEMELTKSLQPNIDINDVQ